MECRLIQRPRGDGNGVVSGSFTVECRVGLPLVIWDPGEGSSNLVVECRSVMHAHRAAAVRRNRLFTVECRDGFVSDTVGVGVVSGSGRCVIGCCKRLYF